MSIIIKGLNMPNGDEEIRLRIDAKGEVYIYGAYPTQLYEAYELPPHGRLIDADALMKDGWVLQKHEEKPTHVMIHTMPLNCPSVPTIIEAEGTE